MSIRMQVRHMDGTADIFPIKSWTCDVTHSRLRIKFHDGSVRVYMLHAIKWYQTSDLAEEPTKEEELVPSI